MNSISVMLLAWVLALVLDVFYGEYPNALHPVVWMGRCIECGERIFLGRGRQLERWGGILMVITIPGIFCFGSWKSIQLLDHQPFWQCLVATFWFKASFALKALGHASKEVRRHLQTGDIQGARHDLRSLCSRNAEHLSEEEVTEAAISSLAENLSDSVIAPWLFAAIFGIPGAIVYRAVNTMDAMIGYRNQYRYLGWAAARTDDALNLIPARLSALLLLASGMLQRLPRAKRRSPSGLEAWAVARRDHHKTPSPNGGWPMATMAGLLGIQLRKAKVYTLGTRQQASELHLLGEAWLIAEHAAWLAWPLLLLLAMGRHYYGFI